MKLKDLHDKLDILEQTQEVEGPSDAPIPFTEFCRHLSIRKRGAREDEGLIRFDPKIWSKGQKRLAAYLVRKFKQKKPVRLVVHKIRQRAKISTMAQAWMLYRVHFQRERKAAVAAHLDLSSREIFQNIHRFMDNMPASLRRPMDEDRVLRQELRYSKPWNSTFVCASAGAVEQFRGGHIHYFHGSEVAFYSKPDDFFQAVSSSFPGTEETWDSCVILEGTARGRGWFYDKCMSAQNDPLDEFEFMFFSWKDESECQIPLEEGERLDLTEYEREYQLKYELSDAQMKWALHMVRNVCFGKWEVFHQEFPVESSLAFDYTGHPLFDRQRIRDDRLSIPDPVFRGHLNWASTNTHAVVEEADEFGSLTLWERPRKGVEYFLPFDVGEGLRADFTEISIMRVEDGIIYEVGRWRTNRVRPDEAGVVAFKLGVYFNYGLIIPEVPGPGANSAQILRDGHPDYQQTWGGYPNIYHRERYDRATKEVTSEIAFLASRHNKGRYFRKFGELYDMGNVKVRSAHALDQMAGTAYDPETEKWIQNHRDPETGMYNDDGVTSTGIGVFVISGEDRSSDRRAQAFMPQVARADF